MNKYVCVHGHFYQPPRENPWLEEVEFQDSAYPYHDWNARITAECYAPNTAARILDADRKISNILNNYAFMSFDVGPTLHAWLERHSPELSRKIIETDEEARKKFSGHGPAIAQIYNHIIMPLASEKDKRTQVKWGIKDFEYRFKRPPEGIWLSEAAVDISTLEILAEHGIKFTILGQHQAQKARKIGEDQWLKLDGHKIDPKMPYLCRLPSGKSIALFFYDNAISGEIAFSGILNNGQLVAEKLNGAFSKEESNTQIVSIATDGETFGHHHRFGEMALAYCFQHLESKGLAKITVYGEYLELHPPTHEVEIFENSSWSCIHGIERWRNNCGCKVGAHRGWTQEWRTPLRAAMDWLRDTVAPIYEEEMKKFVFSPWDVRDAYIEVILDRSPQNVENFISKYNAKKLSHEEKVQILKLLEMQRHAMLMYTSCGWFFDEISGIETIQIIQYAARVMQLAKEISGIELEPHYMKLLEAACSNIPKILNGKHAYEIYVKESAVNLLQVGAHYAVSSLFKDYAKSINIYCYTAKSDVVEHLGVGRQKLLIGRAKVTSNITMEEKALSFAVSFFGDNNLISGVAEYNSENLFSQMQQEIKAAFKKIDISEVIQLIDRYFGSHNYSLRDLFKDEQIKVINQIIGPKLKNIEDAFQQIYEQQYPVMQIMKDLRVSLPRTLSATLNLILSQRLIRTLEQKEINLELLQELSSEVKHWSSEIDKAGISFIAGRRINEMMIKISESPDNLPYLRTLRSLLHILGTLPIELDLWGPQNIYFLISRKLYVSMRENANSGNASAKQWLDHFNSLGHCLGMKLP